jgi:hypothetical protein
MAKVKSSQQQATAQQVRPIKAKVVRLSGRARVNHRIHESSTDAIPYPVSPPGGRLRDITSKGPATTVKKYRKHLDSQRRATRTEAHNQ